MINLFSHNTDSIPFVLKRDVVASIDTIPANDFYSYEYLPLDTSKLFYDVDRIVQEVVFSGLEGVARPFLQQIGGVLFLVFTILFIFGAIVFKNSGLSHFTGIRNIFNFDNRKKKSTNQPITVTDAWSKIFYVFQTYLIFSIFFFAIAAQASSLYFNTYDYLILYLQISAGFFLFVLVKFLFYQLIGSVFSKDKINNLIDAYISVFYVAGILSFLPIVAFIYIPEAKLYVLFYVLVVFIVGRLAVIVQSYIFFVKAHIGNSYFFVYLCGVEIMPYLLLYKAIVLIN